LFGNIDNENTQPEEKPKREVRKTVFCKHEPEPSVVQNGFVAFDNGA
jgi:hypothetical protein